MDSRKIKIACDLLMADPALYKRLMLARRIRGLSNDWSLGYMVEWLYASVYEDEELREITRALSIRSRGLIPANLLEKFNSVA